MAILRRKVLIADDEPGVRRLLREILNREYDVLEAQNGREAVAMTVEQRPDVVLLDMMMPEMDGLTACGMIKKEGVTRAIPVIIVSAVAYDLNKKLARDGAGASAYVTKPFTRAALLATVSDVLSCTQVSPEFLTTLSTSVAQKEDKDAISL
jgi:CheY-like chemotaxis protein